MRQSIQISRPMMADKMKPLFDEAAGIIDNVPTGKRSIFILNAIKEKLHADNDKEYQSTLGETR